MNILVIGLLVGAGTAIFFAQKFSLEVSYFLPRFSLRGCCKVLSTTGLLELKTMKYHSLSRQYKGLLEFVSIACFQPIPVAQRCKLRFCHLSAS